MKRLKPAFGMCLTTFLAFSATAVRAQGLSTPLGGSAPAGAPDALVSVPADYRLDIGDTIDIDVPHHPDVTRRMPIPDDGMVRLPRLRQPVSVRGKTCGELAEELADRWKHVLRLRPGQVTVAVASQRTRRIYVRGSATKGGDFNLKPDWRVSELIATLGGVPQPDRVVARITNERRPAEQNPILIDLDAALNVPGSPENIPLLEGDTLTLDVPKTIRLLIVGEGPRGEHEIDSRYGLRRALGQKQFSTNGATGSLRDARLYRKRVPGDPNSEEEIIPVDLLKLMNGEINDISLRDMDVLVILPSQKWIYVFGEALGARLQYLPEDRKSYLADVIARAGGTTGNARIGQIAIRREVNGEKKTITVDFGKWLGGDKNPSLNPEILPQDLIYVPNVKRADIGSFFTGLHLYNIMKSFGIPLP